MEEAHKRFGAKFHAYSLMGNHYYLLVETPFANLDRVMRHINGVYTQRYNRFKHTDGTLFRGRYKAILIDESAYLLQVSRYIHRNPVEVKGAGEGVLNTYEWSRYLAYIGGKTDRPSWLTREPIHRMLDGNSPCQSYRKYVSAGIDVQSEEFYGGECLTGIFGDKSFRQSVYDEQQSFEAAEGVSSLIKSSQKMDIIVEAVAQVFCVEVSVILRKKLGKRQSNIPRRIAMYCAHHLGDYTQIEVAEYFALTHPGSVSSAVRSVRKNIDAGEYEQQLIEGPR